MFDEDYDFTPSTNSNLQSLFTNENSNRTSDITALFYQAPKQPTPNKPQTEIVKKDNIGTSVIIAKVVHVWKLNDNKYKLLGKLGIAVIGSNTQHEMILYKDQQNILTRVLVSSLLELTVKKDNFISFYSNEYDNWLLKMNSEEDLNSLVQVIEKLGGKILKTDSEQSTIFKAENKTIENEKYDVEEAENKAKFDILNRIARMGQSILPNKTGDDVETVIDVQNNNKVLEDEGVIATTSNSHTKIMPLPCQNIPNNVIITNQSPPLACDALNVLFAENRTQNTEVRMNLTHISEKLNHILQVVNSQSCQQPKSDDNDLIASLKSRIKVLELRVDNLSTALKESETSCAKLQNEYEQNENLKPSIDKLENELALLKDEHLLDVKRFEEKIQTDTKIIGELNETIEMQLIEIKNLNEKISESSQTQNSSCQGEILQLHNKISELELCLDESVKNKKVLQNEKDELAQKIEGCKSQITDLFKEAMNEMYSNILSNFSDEESYSTTHIQSVVGKNIKATSRQIFQNIQDIMKNEV